MPALKKCYYEVLGVERNAGDDEIKKSFRRLALQLHPDKNPDRVEEAKAEFQLLQQAYGVLSNPQERAWYDEHRQAVLREGLDPDFMDDFNMDLMAFCTSSCYKGFGDDEEGFYSVYRELFAKLTAEELEAGWAEENDEDIPSFGDSESTFDDVVGAFYAFWESFCTLKSFAWNDEYDTRRAECRRIARLMGKENKKIRAEAKKAWNREVRALVDFVKRKDKRVHAWKAVQEAKMKEKEIEMSKKAEEQKANRLKERKRLLESVKAEKERREKQHNPILQEMEQWMSNEFGEQLSGDDSDDAPTYLHCAACNKSFRTEQSYVNHEKSKKHTQQMEKLKALMQEDDEMLEEEPDVDEEDRLSAPEKLSESDDDQEDEAEDDVVVESADKDGGINGITKGIRKSRISESANSNTGKSENEGEDDLADDFIALTANRNRKAQTSVDADGEDDDECIPETAMISSEEDKPKKEKTKKRRAKKDKSKVPELASTSAATVKDDSSSAPTPKNKPQNPSSSIICAVCNQKFPSRSQLFRHIKSTGHAAPLEIIKGAAAAASTSEKKSSKKQKNRKAQQYDDSS